MVDGPSGFSDWMKLISPDFSFSAKPNEYGKNHDCECGNDSSNIKADRHASVQWCCRKDVVIMIRVL